ncbi:MAG: divergent polysaccharide deacetylase family protein [Thermodesulfobacteriota bacterium]
MAARKKGGSGNIYLVFIAFVLASIVTLIFIDCLPLYTPQGTAPPFEEACQRSKEYISHEPPILTHQSGSPKIAIIIDDLGYDKCLAGEFIHLDLPLTLSILPLAPYTRLIAHKAKQGGREIMLHLPMEPKRYPRINPGDGVLLVSMENDAILQVLDRDLEEIPFVAGVNNHMGSRFTENKDKMMVVLEELKGRGLYFIDSKTTRHSVAFDLAKQMELRTATRDVFLDNELSDAALEIQMDRLLALARNKGHAICIGHPHPETLCFLRGLQMKLNSTVEVVPVSSLLSP